MAPKTKTLTPVRGRRYRISRLDACGSPVYGDNSQVVTSGVITASFTSNTSETEEIRVQNSAGETCVLESATVSLESISAEIQFCGMDPDMFEIMTGMPVDRDFLGRAIGIRVDVGVDLSSFSFALEIWTGLATDEGCGEVGTVEYGYILLPYMKGGRLSDFTVENAAINFTIADATSRKGGQWGRGPYNVQEVSEGVAGRLLSPLTNTQIMLLTRTTVAPPAALEGGRPLLDPTRANLTSVTGTEDGLEVDVVVSPAMASGGGVYYEFGDGSWEYVEGPGTGAYTHTYEEPGTYTITATSNNGTVVSDTVTVTDGS